jgi:hypothetical protein
MLYIANIREKEINTDRIVSRTVTQLIEADDESSATTKLNNYYNSLNSGSMSYSIKIIEINPTIN